MQLLNVSISSGIGSLRHLSQSWPALYHPPVEVCPYILRRLTNFLNFDCYYSIPLGLCHSWSPLGAITRFLRGSYQFLCLHIRTLFVRLYRGRGCRPDVGSISSRLHHSSLAHIRHTCPHRLHFMRHGHIFERVASGGSEDRWIPHYGRWPCNHNHCGCDAAASCITFIRLDRLGKSYGLELRNCVLDR